MRYLKRYNENVVEDINHQAFVKIREYFTSEIVDEMLSKEKNEWSDDYSDNSNGEAEEIVIHQMISWYKKEYKNLNSDEESKLENVLKQQYNLN